MTRYFKESCRCVLVVSIPLSWVSHPFSYSSQLFVKTVADETRRRSWSSARALLLLRQLVAATRVEQENTKQLVLGLRAGTILVDQNLCRFIRMHPELSSSWKLYFLYYPSWLVEYRRCACRHGFCRIPRDSLRLRMWCRAWLLIACVC